MGTAYASYNNIVFTAAGKSPTNDSDMQHIIGQINELVQKEAGIRKAIRCTDPDNSLLFIGLHDELKVVKNVLIMLWEDFKKLSPYCYRKYKYSVPVHLWLETLLITIPASPGKTYE